MMPLKCKECGNLNSVNIIATFWSCGGAHCFDFEFCKFEGENKPLCHDCENNLFHCCSECGDLIDNDCLFGAAEYDDEGNLLGLRCPGCGKFMDY